MSLYEWKIGGTMEKWKNDSSEWLRTMWRAERWERLFLITWRVTYFSTIPKGTVSKHHYAALLQSARTSKVVFFSFFFSQMEIVHFGKWLFTCRRFEECAAFLFRSVVWGIYVVDTTGKLVFFSLKPIFDGIIFLNFLWNCFICRRDRECHR